MRRIANYENALRRKLAPGALDGPRAGETPKLIPLVVIIRKCADLEIMPDAVMRQLEFRAPLQISCQQPENHVGTFFQRVEQFENSGQQSAIRCRQQRTEVMQIPVKKRGEVLRRFSDTMFLKNLPRDERIGAAGNFDRAIILVDAESFFEAKPQCALPRPATREERSIDIEEHEFAFQDRFDWEGQNAAASARVASKSDRRVKLSWRAFRESVSRGAARSLLDRAGFLRLLLGIGTIRLMMIAEKTALPFIVRQRGERHRDAFAHEFWLHLDIGHRDEIRLDP